jgi:hypothetical protein
MVSLSGLLLTAVVAVGPRDGGEPREDGPHIEWEAAAGCPSVEEIAQATRRYLGAELQAYAGELVARARVEPAPAGGLRLELSIRVDGLAEHHELHALDCDRLGRDAALLIATAIDPFARGPVPGESPRFAFAPPVQRPARVAIQRPQADRSAPAPTAPLARAPAERAPPEFGPLLALAAPSDRGPVGGSDEGSEANPALSGFLGAGGLGFAGVFPAPSGGVAIEGGLERGLLRWQLGAGAWLGGRFRPASDFGADLRAWTGSTALCVVPRARRWSFPLCASAGVGAMSARAVGTTQPRTTTRPWAYAGADLRARWTPSATGAGTTARPVSVYLGIAALPNLVKPSWALTNPDATFGVPPVTGLLRLGVELRGMRKPPRHS